MSQGSRVMPDGVLVAGCLGRPEFHCACAVLQAVHSARLEEISEVQCLAMMEFQWAQWLLDLQKEHGGELWGSQEPVVVLLEGGVLRGLHEVLTWALDTYGYQNSREMSEYDAVAREAYNKHINNPESDFVFFDVCVEGDLMGRLVLELFRSLCPRTVENFVCLCTGEKGSEEGSKTRLSYVNSLFHRVLPGGWVQGGDICGGSGDGGLSIYGKTFQDESFAVPHLSAGVLGMANHGRNTNSSQFYITLQATPWMDQQYVAFGRVVEGSKLLHRLSTLETYNERPKERCQISNCGRLPFLTSNN